MQELWLLEILKSWCQNPHVACSLVEGPHQLRHCVKWHTPLEASISTTIPYIDWLLLGRWFIVLLLLLFGSFSFLHRWRFRPSKSPLSAVHSQRGDLGSTTMQFTRYWVLFLSIFLCFFLHWWMYFLYCFLFFFCFFVFLMSFPKSVLVSIWLWIWSLCLPLTSIFESYVMFLGSGKTMVWVH